MASQKSSINLIPEEEAKKRARGKFLKWILTYGRYIIIGTEIVLLLILLFRFKLDQDLKSLSEDIKTKKERIESFGDLEEQTRALQAHLATIKDLGKQGLPATGILTSLASLTPQDVIFSNLKVSPKNINVSATAFSLGGFAAFIEGLKHSENFKEITLEKVRRGPEGIEFTLKFNYTSP